MGAFIKYTDELTELVREQLRVYYAQLTPKQAEVFNRKYGSIEDVTYEQMPWAYGLMRNTIDRTSRSAATGGAADAPK